MNLGGWGTFQNDVSIHVIPISDLRPHVCGHICWCQPEIDDDGEVWLHHAMDGREDFEDGIRLLS